MRIRRLKLLQDITWHQEAHEQVIAALVGRAFCEYAPLDIGPQGQVLPTANPWLKQFWQDTQALDGTTEGPELL